MMFPLSATRSLWLPVIGLLLAGCAQDRIRNDSARLLREGNFEQALQGFQEGVREYPDNTALRAGLTSARAEVITRLVASTSQLRDQGKFDEAERAIERALAMEPASERLLAVQSDLSKARRQKERVAQASSLAKSGNRAAALEVLTHLLRESPRLPDALALQRGLEAQLRAEREDSGLKISPEARVITLDFRGAPLSTVLDAITRSSGIQFIIDRDVKQDGRITVFLKSARVEDAIEIVVGSQQLAQRIIDSKTVLVYPNTIDKQREHQNQVIRVFNLAHVEAKTTAALLRSMLKIKEPFIDERANLVAIRETPEIVTLAERLVALHDVAEAEVMLEVEVLEVRTGRLTELGINFPNSFSLTPLSLPGTTGQTVDSLSNLGSDRIGVTVAGLLVKLRREVGDFNILANPRIRTKSKEKARIVIGDKVPLVTATTNATGFVADSISYLDVGLKLEVEPVVSPDDEVTIKLALEVSSLAKEVRTTSGTLAYQIGTRNANTTLRLRDGETQLLGGLISNEDRSSSNRVPGLGDLPIAGRLFSSQLDDVQRTELVLAITPRIVRSAPRPDVSQSEMWVGTEMNTRLRPTPGVLLSTPPTPPNKARDERSSASTSNLVGSTKPAPTTPDLPIQVTAAWQAPANTKTDATFTATLVLSSGQALRGAPLEIAYPIEFLEVLAVNEGAFFKKDDPSASFNYAINPSNGTIGASILGADPVGAKGRDTVLQIQFRAKKAGQAQISVKSLKPVGLTAIPVVVELPSHAIAIQ